MAPGRGARGERCAGATSDVANAIGARWVRATGKAGKYSIGRCDETQFSSLLVVIAVGVGVEQVVAIGALLTL